MNNSYGIYFAQPWWLAAGVLLIPVVWLAIKNMRAVGRTRRIMAIVLRCLVLAVLICLLARPMLTRKSRQLTVVTVLDRSLSIPPNLRDACIDYLSVAAADRPDTDRFAQVDVAEAASISKLPSADVELRERNTTLTGHQSRLANGVEMAMAILPPDTAARILLVSEGNETGGSLKQAAETAAANKIPIDVLPVRYRYDSEVLFRRLAAPDKARSGETVSLRFIMDSTRNSKGKLLLNLNDEPVDLDPGSSEVAARVELEPGTNVQTMSIPVGTRGVHEFEAYFVPDDPNDDRITENNPANSIVYVSGPGHILVVDTDGAAGAELYNTLQGLNIDVRHIPAAEFTDNLARLMDVDAIIMADVDAGSLTFQQQEMLCRYVTDFGGGLIMVGGPNSFGAGGWIGSPVAKILPVDLDPPQKKQMPKGALVLIMHACEMPQGNYWGKKVAVAAVKTLSRLDLVGVLAYNWEGGSDWVFPLAEVGDKQKLISSIEQMQMGDMPDLHSHLKAAYDSLVTAKAGQKHVIVISDGDPNPPTPELLNKCKQAQITCTGVAVFPHSPADVQSLLNMARATNGRFYNVKDPQQLPQIFIKEAQVVRRALIVEETFTPKLTYGLSELMRGVSSLPSLDGYVLTGPKPGLSQMVLASTQDDPILATCQMGLGRCIAFTSSADTRWGANWVQWEGFRGFWEQAVRWAAGTGQSADCEVHTDVQGRDVIVNVETVDAEGRFIQLASIEGQVIAPDMTTRPIHLDQTGPGQYRAHFSAPGSGSYVVNLQYRRIGEDAKTQIKHTVVTIPFAPEFRDLADNAPLLAQISDLTGGRVLPADPNAADLYNRAGLEFPQTHTPLTMPLMFAWIVLLLLDVAVRRVVLDVRAIVRRLAARAKPRKSEADQVLANLKARRRQVQDQISSTAAKRYEAPTDFKGPFPTSKIDQPPAGAEAKKKPPEGQEKASTGESASHIQRLLDAKRKASEGDKSTDDA